MSILEKRLENIKKKVRICPYPKCQAINDDDLDNYSEEELDKMIAEKIPQIELSKSSFRENFKIIG